ncbi:MAG: nitroreductase family protein [Pirellulales bacterium]|nr:nitroreductase family protein [Pirellulales bacterium]
MTVMHSLHREPGRVSIDEATCKQCGQCAEICPADVLRLDGGRVRVDQRSPFGCIACGHCMMVCPEGSITVTGRGISPDDLRPLPPPESRATADQLAALMLARRSVRRFQDRDVAPEVLGRVVEMAASGPMGIPPWDVGCVVIRGRDQVQQLAAEVIRGYEQFLKVFRPWLLTLLRPFVRRATYEQFRHFIRPLAQTYVESRRRGRDVLFYDAPAVLLFHHSPYAEATDAAIACTCAMLAAESLGLGNTIIGGAPPILQRNKALCRRLGVPEGNTPSIALIAGYPATHFRRSVRRGFSHLNTVD